MPKNNITKEIKKIIRLYTIPMIKKIKDSRDNVIPRINLGLFFNVTPSFINIKVLKNFIITKHTKVGYI